MMVRGLLALFRVIGAIYVPFSVSVYNAIYCLFGGGGLVVLAVGGDVTIAHGEDAITSISQF